MKISVVIPCYNVEKYVSRCLESVLKQDFSQQNFEILAINDGSTDRTLEVLRKYEEQYPQIRVIDQANKGLGETRNVGIEKVESDYIAFLDSDDWIDQDYLKVLYSLAKESNLDIVNSGFRRPKPNGEILFQSHLLNRKSSFFTNGTAWGKLYRTQFLKENQIKNRISAFGEDIIFNFDCFEAGAKFKTTEYIGYNWFINDESLTRSNRDEEKIVETCKIFYKTLCETSSKINSYYIILYASATLFTANVGSQAFRKLSKEMKSISKKKVTTSDYLKAIFNYDKGIAFKLKMGTLIYSVATITRLTPLLSFLKISNKVKRK